MGIRVAYGNRNNIGAAISSGVVPKDSIIITKDDDYSAELFFYDVETKLKHIVAKTKFGSVEDALLYAISNSVSGNVVTVLEDGKYRAYVVQPDGGLEPIDTGLIAPDGTNLLDRVIHLEKYSHAHGNKTLLDSLTKEQIDRWDALAEAFGGEVEGLTLVKSSSEANSITVTDEKTMEVNEVSLSKIVQSEGEELVINGG